MASIPHSEQFAVVTFDVIANAPIAPKNTIGLADNGDRYISTGTGWIKTHTNGAAQVDAPPYGSFEYQDATYLYQCEFVAGPTAARSSPNHRVIRTTLADNTFLPAGTGDFKHKATDIATVAALTYTLGA